MQMETLKERTWRERQEAKAAVESALHDLVVAQDEAKAAQQRYWDALDAQERSVQANVDAWKDEPEPAPRSMRAFGRGIS
jgi:hypothetical protein